MTSPTANATIYYTTDGSTPTVSSTIYSTPIAVTACETINAFAAALGYNSSPVASAAYVLITAAPVPAITSLSPAYISAGSPSFPFTVNGSGFTTASSITWGSSALTTQFISSTQLTATVSAANVSSVGIISVAVQTRAAGGGTPNALQFEIDTSGASASPSFAAPTATVTAGSSATYAVTLPLSASHVSVNCLNLPYGVACSYSSSAGALTITTTSATPSGTYLVTVVFTETLPGAALAFLFLPILLSPIGKSKLHRNLRKGLCLLIAAVASVGLAAGCASGGGSSTPPPATHQATSSGTVTLIVK